MLTMATALSTTTTITTRITIHTWYGQSLIGKGANGNQHEAVNSRCRANPIKLPPSTLPYCFLQAPDGVLDMNDLSELHQRIMGLHPKPVDRPLPIADFFHRPSANLVVVVGGVHPHDDTPFFRTMHEHEKKSFSATMHW